MKKTGFDPTEIETEDIPDQPFCDFNSDMVDFISPSVEDAKRMVD